MFRFGNEAKALATMSGIFVAIGEVLGGAVFGIFGQATVKRGRDPIVVLGFVLSMVAYFLVFLNMPDDATYAGDKSIDTAYIGTGTVPVMEINGFEVKSNMIVSCETNFDSKQPKMEPKLVSKLSETRRLFRLFRFNTVSKQRVSVFRLNRNKKKTTETNRKKF
jgi:hypothetical protein